MNAPRPPQLEPRRFNAFERELRDRARAWIPSWGLADSERDFGQALLEIAARFSAEVAERLDRVGDKMARGFLDWLAVRGEAARPARMPVVFKLAETALEPVQAPHPVRMQVEAGGTNVTFETETDIRLVTGQIELVVGADPVKDAFFLPPPGLSSLDPLEPLPTQWRLKSFAAPASTMLQFDPGLGLKQDMLVEIEGAQYRISNPKDDLAKIDPAVPPGDGFAVGTLVTKVEWFYPFEGARDQQNHILYLGGADLFNLEAETTIDIVGIETLGPGATWEYWGKAKDALATDADPRWRTLARADAIQQKPDALVLTKPEGTIEPREVGSANSRWIRARMAHLEGDRPSLTADQIALRINSSPQVPLPSPIKDPAKLPPIEAIVNTTPSPTNNFYPLGREPRMFDTFYLGCAEAFSKKGAAAEVDFDLADPSFLAMAAIDAGAIGNVLAGVDKAGALHLFQINPNGTLARLSGRAPLLPPGQGIRLTSAAFRPVMWTEASNLHVAVAAGDQIWVWKEIRPSSSSSDWVSFGSPPANTDPQSKIDGLVAINRRDPVTNIDTMMLVALRDKRLSIRAASGGTAWDPLQADDPLGTPLEIEAIAQVRHENPAKRADHLLAVAAESAPVDHGLYAVSSGSVVQRLFLRIANDVTPCAIQRNSGLLEAVAVGDGATRKLRALRTGAAIDVDLGAGETVADTGFDVRIEGSQFAAYCVARSVAIPPGPPSLLAWMPFDPDIKEALLRIRSDPSIGSPARQVTLFGARAYIPGNSESEILSAELNGIRSRLDTDAAKFRSAVAVRIPSPTTKPKDTIAPFVGARPRPAIVADVAQVIGRSAFSNQRFIWLDRWLKRGTNGPSSPFYETSSPAPLEGIVKGARKLELDADDPTTTADSPWLLVADDVPGSNARKIVKVDSVSGGVANVDRDLPVTTLEKHLSYWLPSGTIPGSVHPALELVPSNSNWNIDALDHGDFYFPSLGPIRQQVIAVADDALVPPHPQWLAFESAWTAGQGPPNTGTIEFVVDGALTAWVQVLGDTSSNPALAWEYWNGTGWWRLEIDKDETHNLKNSGLVTFKVPDDLKPVDSAGKTNHWIRARLIGGDYGRETVIVKTKITSPTTSEQTVERSTEGIQPPYALSVLVRYRVDEPVLPAYLLTQDSGMLRDQSDANRTPDVRVEVFTPLIHTLRRFEVPVPEASKTTDKCPPKDTCVPDCECPSGAASTSPSKALATAGATAAPLPSISRAGRRALYLGLNSKLSGEPINVILVVAEERGHDKLAPLTIETLMGDRFIPVVASDGTRALGETGLVSMSLSIAPTPAALFGKSLSWLRLTPGEGDGTIEWKPTLRGAYLNAVWARAAETMTRELVGSSEGMPNLALQLARPPLLKDTLELRVREPLGQEELDQLLARNPDTVKSDVTDLPGHWVLWKQVADPVDYEASARVYSLDEDSGTIRFGDGQHGAIPPIGADAIVAFKYERTEPAAAGVAVPANLVAARSPLNLVTPIESVETAIAADHAAGGVAPEPDERVLRFGAAKLRHRGRALTARDFEDLALERLADVVQARCFARSGKIRLIVVMRGADPQPTQAQRRELRRVLLGVSPATLGIRGALRIEGPTVRRLRVHLALRVATLDRAGELATHVKKTLRSFFDTETGGERDDGWALGASPREEDIAEALLDAPNLESIASIALSEIDSNGGEQVWPQRIGASELAMLADDGVRIGFEIVETVE